MLNSGDMTPTQFASKLENKINEAIAYADIDVDYVAKVLTFPATNVLNRCYCDPEYEKEGLEFLRKHLHKAWQFIFA